MMIMAVKIPTMHNLDLSEKDIFEIMMEKKRKRKK